MIKVFISYAWTDEAYKQKVLELATKLRKKGIDIILDIWDLHAGEDRFLFMEKSVAEADKVLILCNKVYKDKADNRNGGAGQEAMIIAPEVYEKNSPEKFIPVIMEHDSLGQKYIPQYLKNLIYIDYTDKNEKEQCDDLVYAIYGCTPYVKPEIGEVPNYIKEKVHIEDKKAMHTNFGKRLNTIIEMINASTYESEHINLEIIGDMMGLQSVNELNKYYYGQEEPTYEFIDKLCVTLGLNKNWMKFGKDMPYKNELAKYYNPEELLDEICTVNKIFFFTIREYYRRELGVIVKNDTYNYQCYPKAYTFHSDVGCGGASELCLLYSFLKCLNKMGKMPSEVYCVSKDEFYNLLEGAIYPGIICKPHRDNFTYMLDDFIDLYRDDKKKEDYLIWYGQTFIDSQNLIKSCLNNKV